MAKKKKDELLDAIEEKIIDTPLQKAVHNYMIPYSEYVILDRALPRVEDGLKPVQRRVLYTMYEMNLKPDGPFKKSARVVGDCMGKYHPHGNDSIYNAMVVMSQDFKMRETLVKGHGNFGSVDGDKAAAMRYTEVKLQPLAYELMKDLEKGTVPWAKNFDETLEEPEIFPGRFPNLLVNGCPTGIAVGLTTKIPPHNLGEVIDGVIAYIDNPSIKLKEMMNYIKGPDFPTGGYIEGGELEKMYETGEGKFAMSAKYDIEINENDKQSIVFTELPYEMNKAKIQEEILALRDALTEKNGKNDNILGGITDIADESDRRGMRVVLKLKKGEDASKIVRFLFQKTKLMQNYCAVFVAIVNGKPEQLGLLQIIKHYVNYQKTVVLNRSKYENNLAKKRAHIVEGFVLILPDIREVCDIIIDSNSASEAKMRLKARFSISDAQADAVLATKLSGLTKMERTKLEKELAELQKRIAEYEKIIGSVKEQLKVVKKELTETRNKYKTKRQTIIVDSIDETFINPYEVSAAKGGKSGYVVIGNGGKLKFLNKRQFMNAHKGAVENGLSGVIKQAVYLESGDYVIVFSNLGNCYRLKTDNIVENKWTDKGSTLSEMYDTAEMGEYAVSLVVSKVSNPPNQEILIYTKKAQLKRSSFNDYIVNKDSYQGMVLKDGDDEVIGAEKRIEDTSIVLVSKKGMLINTEAEEFNAQGRKAGGVTAMNLEKDDELIYMAQCMQEIDVDGPHSLGEILIGTDKGFSKRVIIDYIKRTKRGNKGDKLIDMDEKKDRLSFAFYVLNDFNFATASTSGEIMVFNTEDVMIEQRKTKGRKLPGITDCDFAVKEIPDGDLTS